MRIRTDIRNRTEIKIENERVESIFFVDAEVRTLLLFELDAPDSASTAFAVQVPVQQNSSLPTVLEAKCKILTGNRLKIISIHFHPHPLFNLNLFLTQQKRI